MIDPKQTVELLLKIKSLLETIDVKFFLCEGTLLGAIRENKFLDDDKDVDIGIFHENQEQIKIILVLLAENFPILYVWRNSELGITEISLKTAPKIDIFFYFIEKDYTFNIAYKKNKNQYISKKYLYKKFQLKQLLFLDNMFYIPDNPEDYLSNKYGDWKRRDEQWDWFYGPKNSIGYKTFNLDVDIRLDYISLLFEKGD
jgi:hypothetical protein